MDPDYGSTGGDFGWDQYSMGFGGPFDPYGLSAAILQPAGAAGAYLSSGGDFGGGWEAQPIVNYTDYTPSTGFSSYPGTFSESTTMPLGSGFQKPYFPLTERSQFLPGGPGGYSWSRYLDPVEEQRRQFNWRTSQVWPFLRYELWPWAKNFAARSATAGGKSPFGPEITVGGIWNPQQTQQQVNAMQAGIAESTASRIREMQGRVAGHGFGANSPLAQQLAQGYQNQALGQQVGGERDIRLQAAQANAGQLLRTQALRQQQFEEAQKIDVERRKPYFALLGSLLGNFGNFA